jgi:hypothetical protein
MLRTVFVVDTFVAGAFGIVLVAAPELLMQLYGIQTDAGGIFIARLLGAFVLGQGPLLWWARDETATPAGLAITRGHGIIDTISTVVCTAAILRGTMNAGGWVVVALFVAFGSVRVYYGFIRQPSAAAT